MRSDFSVVDQQMSRGGQDVTFKLLATFRLVGDDNKDITRKFRFEIKSDSYRQQCYARVEVWSKTSLCWNEVYRLRGEEMATPEGLHHKPFTMQNNPKAFDADLERLMKVVETVVC